MLAKYKEVTSKFYDFVFDWNYQQYLLLGGYGSGKSFSIALKIILKCFEEKRTVLIVREVYSTHAESTVSLITEILSSMDLLTTEYTTKKTEPNNKVRKKTAPYEFTFPNGSRIIFKGMDKAEKVKSIHGISIVWLEECSEIKYNAYKELLGRVRTKDVTMHFILSCNPVGKENWIYRHFFCNLDEQGHEKIIVDENELYKRGTLINNNIYYHHSTPDDNPFLPRLYLDRLDDIKTYDPTLWVIARWGRFGQTGLRVLPQLSIAKDPDKFKQAVNECGINNFYYGFDFGFEESFNAVISMAVNPEKSILYIYDEIYQNKITDDKFAQLKKMQKLKNRINQQYENGNTNAILIADNEDPKAIQYYKQCGFRIRGCKNKFAGSRLSNTRKIKRFKKIIVSPKCKNVIRELNYLTYARKSNGDIIHDKFNIDPHSFSAIWYGLDSVTVADLKDREFNSIKGWGKNAKRKY